MTNIEKTSKIFEDVKRAAEKTGGGIQGTRQRVGFVVDVVRTLDDGVTLTKEDVEDVVGVIELCAGRQLKRKKGQPGFTQEEIDAPGNS